MNWFLLLLAVLVLVLAGMVYLIFAVSRFNCIRRIAKNKKSRRFLIGLAIILILSIILGFTMGPMNLAVCILHLLVFWMVADLIGWIIKRIAKKTSHIYYQGVITIIFTIAYLSVGWYLCHHVWQTIYPIDTDKPVGQLRVIQFADSHVGTSFHVEGFKAHMDEIQNQHPDVLLVTGDFVDDDTTLEDMLGCCEALGNVETTYGTYFSFGNHDKGYYASKRGYTGDDLIAELEKHGVQVLEDETVLINDRFYIIGRQDRSEPNRASMEELTKDLDPDKYTIVMDHQPNDYKAQRAAAVDLVLSGHTHGGQLIPILYVGEWIGANDQTYGHTIADVTHFIVTSGISDWAIKFKTGCKSEYVTIDIKEQRVTK